MGSRRPYGQHYPTWILRAALLSSAIAKGLGTQRELSDAGNNVIA